MNTDDSLNANTVDFSATAAATVGVTVTTAANALVPPMDFWRRMLDGARFAVVALLAMLWLGWAAKQRGRRLRPAYALAGMLLLCAGLWLGCGGGAASTPTPPPVSGTTPGNYTLTVNAYTLTGTGTSPDATVSIPLTVK